MRFLVVSLVSHTHIHVLELPQHFFLEGGGGVEGGGG